MSSIAGCFFYQYPLIDQLFGRFFYVFPEMLLKSFRDIFEAVCRPPIYPCLFSFFIILALRHSLLFKFTILNIDSKIFKLFDPIVNYMADSLGPSLFIEAFGIKNPTLKVLDFFMDNEGFDYSKTEVMEGTDLSRATLFNVWPKLEALELLIETRSVGRAKMYKLNKKNPVVKKLMELDDAISEYYAQKCCNPNDLSGIVEPGKELIKL